MNHVLMLYIVLDFKKQNTRERMKTCLVQRPVHSNDLACLQRRAAGGNMFVLIVDDTFYTYKYIEGILKYFLNDCIFLVPLTKTNLISWRFIT